jgi:isovaleryl-CoA dehydrogenase
MWFFSDEHRMIQETVRQFAQTTLAPRIEELDEHEGFHREAFPKMGELGLLGITVSEADGGAGQGAVSATIAMEEMAAVDASTTLSYLAHAILCVNQIARNGTPEQKQRFLPKLLSGEHIGGMGMSDELGIGHGLKRIVLLSKLFGDPASDILDYSRAA